MTNVSDVDLRLLRVFVAVVEAGGFAAAQAGLNVGASTISNHMAALERRLDVKLCQRGRVGFRLTDKGRVIYEAACRLIGAVEEFRGEAAAVKGKLAGDLRIGLVDNTVMDPLSPVVRAVRRFAAREHRVHFRLLVEAPQELERQLLEGKLDVAVGSFPRRIGGLSYTPLYEERHELYCGRGHPLFDLPEGGVTLQAVREARIVTRGYWNQHDIVRLDLPPSAAAATVYHMEPQAMLILSGAYLGFLPRHYAAAWVRAGELKALMADRISFDAPFDMATRRGVRATRVVSAFAADLLAR